MTLVENLTLSNGFLDADNATQPKLKATMKIPSHSLHTKAQ
jgi:hypothetical protein